MPTKTILIILIISTTLQSHISTSWKQSYKLLAAASDASCRHGVGDMPSVAGGYSFMKTKYTIEQLNKKRPPNSRLTAIRYVGQKADRSGRRYNQIYCLCSCGENTTTLSNSFLQGKTISCGCYYNETRRHKLFTIEKINDRKPKDSRLTAISFSGTHTTPGGQIINLVNVKCSCGKEGVKRQPDIVSGHTKSCGCYEEEVLMKRNTKYSHTIPKLNTCWHDMMNRCYDTRGKWFKNYGGRGVTVFDEWHNYQNFLNWALANGWKEGLQIDKDKNGTGLLYCPAYCCFVTGEENMNYTSQNVKYDYKGELLTLAQIARIEGLEYDKLYRMVNTVGLTVKEAIELYHLNLIKCPRKKQK